MGKGSGTCERVSIALAVESPAPAQAPERPLAYNLENLNYSYITDPDEVQEVVKAIQHPEVEWVALDIETTGGIMPWTGSIRLVQIGVEHPEPRQFLIDCWATDPRPMLKLLDESPSLKITTCNGWFEQLHLGYHYGVTLDCVFDICYGSRAETQRKIKSKKGEKRYRAGNDFRSIIRRYLGKKISKEQQTSAWDAPQLSRSQMEYAAKDVAGLLDVVPLMLDSLREKGLLETAEHTTEQELQRARNLAEMRLDEGREEAQRILRAINHAKKPLEVDEFCAAVRQLPISHLHVEEIEKFARRRRKELKGKAGEQASVLPDPLADELYPF